MERYLLGVLVLLLLASCSGGMPSFNISEIVSAGDPAGFYGHLANEYKNLAAYEEEYMQNQADADYFITKARRALRHQNVESDNPENRNIPEFAQEELVDARDMLIDALDNLNIEENGSLLALAQTSYDCWLAHQEDFPVEDAQIACKPRFYDALSLLHIPEEDSKVYSIYFDSGATTLSAEAQKLLHNIALRYMDRPHWDIVLKGYTDSKGNKQQNKMLSMRRAIAVKNMLGQHGVDLNNIAISAEGEIVTSDEEDSRHSRRVDVRARPHYVAQNKGKLKALPGWRHSLSN